ncbi:MBL fold metallo-hydrolase [candidate division KSB1 bacterium]|nr:MBL fold metallo-hydrolase [candidate division KSB1 bacterium]
MLRKVTQLIVLLLIPNIIFAQLSGYLEDFDDNTLTGWVNHSPQTFNLVEEDSVLKIHYTRTAESGEWDVFRYTPPQSITVVDMPVITVEVKSDVATRLTFKPVYANGNSGWISSDIPDDNVWREVTFNLTAHEGSNLDFIYIYLDGGSAELKSGTVTFDNLKIGDTELNVRVLNLLAVATDSNVIQLTWDCNFPDAVDYYKIFRDDTTGFTCDASTVIDSTALTAYADSNLLVDHTYYYKLAVVDTAGEEQAPSSEVSAHTYRPGEQQLFEAEHATFTDAELMSEPSASNGQYVAMGENGSIQWAFTMADSGWHEVRIGYKNINSDCVTGLIKNGVRWDIGLGWTTAWSEHVKLAFLTQGTNTIELVAGQCLTHIDYIYIDTVAVDPQITPKSNNFYTEEPRDLTVKLNAYGRTISNIMANGSPMTFSQTEYPYEEDAWKVTIDEASLSALDAGVHDVSINYGSGESMTMPVTVIGDTIPAFLTIVAPHVSHGNAVLVIFPTGRTLLIDCGTATQRDQTVIPMLHNNGITELDYFILTHYHEDHDGGDAGETIKTQFNPGQFYDYQDFTAGDTLMMEKCKIKILNAFASGSDENSRSLSFKLEYNGFIYVHGADIYSNNQDAILSQFPDDIQAHVYAANHHLHGSVSAEYYRAMDPCIVFNQAQQAIYARSAYTQTYLIDAVEWLKENSTRYIETLQSIEIGTVVIRANSAEDWTYETYDHTITPVIPYIPQNMQSYEDQTEAPQYLMQPDDVILSDASEINVEFFTNKTATMKYDLSALSFDDMSGTFNVDGLLYHQALIPNPGTEVPYYFRAMDNYGNETPDAVMVTIGPLASSVDGPSAQDLPTRFTLSQNYPNPFNLGTKIEYTLPESATVALSIYDVRGHEVQSFNYPQQPAGYHALHWDGQDKAGDIVSTGVYVYRMEMNSAQQSFTDIQKMILIK